MKKRSMKVLLQIMLDNIDKLDTGLCGLAVELFFYTSEDVSVVEYIMVHRPENARALSFYWPKGEKAPRIKWLKYHIKKLSK